mmetsp:Transcript_21952/g.64635  ORF Transcript_21952/g.64635 Transcript_21952/m.64635 type:complete len:278 (-) Transcript_21952:8241-9074(-)
MWPISFPLTSGSPCSRSKEPMRAVATSASACSGHGRNQSIVQPLMRPGKACARLRNLTPTGEKQSERWRFVRTRSMNMAQSWSWVGSAPLWTESYTGPISPRMASSSSRGKRLGSSPVLRKMLTYSRKPSSLISLSVKRNTTGLPCTPARRYRGLKSSSRLFALYERVMVIWKSCAVVMYAASRVSDCLPDPPTPTSSAEPRDMAKMRVMRMRCSMQSWKNTRSTRSNLKASLNLARYSVARSFASENSGTSSYTLGARPISPVSGSSSPSRRKSQK